MARGASARNLFMGEQMRGGMSMAEASRMWTSHHSGRTHHSNPSIEGFFGRHKDLIIYGGGGLLLLGVLAPTVASQIPIVGPLAVQLGMPLQGIVGGLLPSGGPAPSTAALPPAQQAPQPSSAVNTARRPMGW